MAKKVKPAKRKKGIHILRPLKGGVPSKTEFFVDAVASNGKVLQNSETVKRKQSAFKNIVAMWKLLFDVMSGETAVTDEKGDKWVWDVKKKRFTNSSVMLRKGLGTSLLALAKHAAEKSGKDVVLRGPRGGVLLDTRKKSAKKK